MKEWREELLWRLRAVGIATSQVAKELKKVERVAEPNLINAFTWAHTPQGIDYWANLNRRYVEARNKLSKSRIVDLLRGYCHHPKCRHIRSCPKQHDKCKSRLGLDTAIAWKASLEFCSGDNDELYTLRDALEYHSKEYSRLIWLIQLAIDYLERY